MTTRVVVERLAMRYGDHVVLDGVTFDVAPGSVFALLGPNGAGKTTTVEILEGYRHRTGGDVLVLGTDPERATRRFRDRIGIVLQSTAIDPDLTVIEATRLQAGYHCTPLAPGDALELVALGDARQQRVGLLSGGQRRRLDLALAIVGRPDVLFLDEPTTGFDPEARRAAWHLIEVLRAEGASVVLTTHYLEEAAVLADQVGILTDGRLAALGTPAELAGSASIIRFRTADPTAVAAALGGHVRDDHVVVGSDDPRSDLHRLTETALDRGWRLDDLTVGRRSLEDVYMQLVDPTDG